MSPEQAEALLKQAKVVVGSVPKPIKFLVVELDKLRTLIKEIETGRPK